VTPSDTSRCRLQGEFRSPSPRPSPQGRGSHEASGSILPGVTDSRTCCRRFSLSLRAVHSPQVLYSVPQSRRDCVLQPRVASSELPWVNGVGRCQPHRGCGLRSPLCRRNPVGVDLARVPFPRVARCSQPWALRRNPFGIRLLDDASCGECTALREWAGVKGNRATESPTGLVLALDTRTNVCS